MGMDLGRVQGPREDAQLVPSQVPLQGWKYRMESPGSWPYECGCEDIPESLADGPVAQVPEIVEAFEEDA